VTTPDIAAAMQAAMDAEDQRRLLASATPGLGVLLPLDQPPSGPNVGKYGVGGAIVGEGYDQQAESPPRSTRATGRTARSTRIR
jgi:hypothetical protein